jgi:hypothetical protein
MRMDPFPIMVALLVLVLISSCSTEVHQPQCEARP